MLTDRDRMSDKLFDQSGWGSASTFFFKRWAFRHENEVRLMYNGHSDSSIDLESDIFKFSINPFEVIDEIVFDPRMDKVIYERNKEITQSWGFNKKIIQSGLYKMKEFVMELNHLQ